jgi:hypothetical protein
LPVVTPNDEHHVQHEAAQFITLLGGAAGWVFRANFRIAMSSIMRRRNGLIASSVMGMLLS